MVDKRRISSIDLRLPDDIRERFYEMLNDKRLTGIQITDRINALLEAAGCEERVYRSSVYRKKAQMERIGERLRQSRELASVWIGKLGAQPQGEVGKLLNEMVRNLAFEATMQMADGKDPINPKMLRDLAIAIDRLEKAATENTRRDEQIRKAALEAAAREAGSEVKRRGLSDDAAEVIKAKILGISAQ